MPMDSPCPVPHHPSSPDRISAIARSSAAVSADDSAYLRLSQSPRSGLAAVAGKTAAGKAVDGKTVDWVDQTALRRSNESTAEADQNTTQPMLVVAEAIAPKLGLPLRRRPAEALRVAIDLFSRTNSWVVFFREILGVDGTVRKLFTTVDQMRFWEASPECGEVLEMVTALRSTDGLKADAAEPLRMITIRLPVNLHDALAYEAKEHGTSVNKLCMSKLLQGVSSALVPVERGKVRGRKPALDRRQP